MTKLGGLNTHENSLPLQAQEDLALVQQGTPKNQTQDKITQQHHKTNKFKQLLTSDITMFSRMGSMGGLVTYENKQIIIMIVLQHGFCFTQRRRVIGPDDNSDSNSYEDSRS